VINTNLPRIMRRFFRYSLRLVQNR